MSISMIVSLGLSVLLALFIIGGVIFGAIRGAKRSGLRLATLAITLVLTFLLTGVVVSALLRVNISFMHFSVNGIEARTPSEGVRLILEGALKDYDVNLAQLSALAVGLTCMALNTIVFPLLFLVLRYLLLPLYWILARIIFGKRRKKDDDDQPINKHSLLGALFGAISGFMIASVVFTPVVGYMNTAHIVEVATVNSENKGLLTKLGGDKYVQLYSGYSSSPYYYVSKYTGMQALSNLMFDNIAKGKINGKNIYITKEIKLLASTYQEFVGVVKGLGLVGGESNFDTLTQSQLDSYLGSMQNLINVLYSSELVVCVGDVALPVIVAYIDDMDKSQMDEYSRAFLVHSIDIAKDYTFEDARQILNSTLNVLKKLNSKNLVLPLFRRDTESIKAAAENIDKEFASEIVEEIFAIDLVKRTATDAISAVVSMLAEAINIDYTAAEGISNDDAVESVKEIVADFADALSGLDTDSWMYYKPDQISKVGVLLDALKNNALITPQTYQSAITKLEQKLCSFIDEMSIGTTVKSDLKLAIDKISEVDNWSAEFTILSNVAVQLDTAVAQDKKLKEGGLKSYDWQYLGRALDGLKQTTMFNHEIESVPFTQKLIIDAIDWLQAEKIGDFGTKIQATVTKVKENVASVSSWETALTGAKDLITVMLDLSEIQDVAAEFRSEGSDLAARMGSALAAADGTPLFANNTIETFTLDMLTIVEDNITSGTENGVLSSAVTGAVNVMRTNINTAVENETQFDWEQEFLNFKTLFKSDFDNLTISMDKLDDVQAIANNIDSVMNLHASKHIIITNEVINTLLSTIVNDALDNHLASETQTKYANQITDIKNGVTAIEGAIYNREITAIIRLKDILTDTSAGHDITDIHLDSVSQMTYFGTKFDELRLSTVVGGIGYSIMSDELDSYISDHANTSLFPDYEYNDVLTIVHTHFTALNNGWKGANANTYYSELFLAFNGVVSGMDTSVSKSGLSANAVSIESMLAQKQANKLISIDGAKVIANIALDKVTEIISSYQADIDSMTDETLKSQAQSKKDAITNYISSYSNYLETSSNETPQGYNNSTYTEVGGIRVNKPFSYIASLASELDGIIG